MESIRAYLVKWNKNNDNLAKLQGVYGALAIVMLVVAGLVSLIHPNFGQSLLFLAVVLTLTFIGNSVVWALIKTFAIPHIEKTKYTSTRKK